MIDIDDYIERALASPVTPPPRLSHLQHRARRRRRSRVALRVLATAAAVGAFVVAPLALSRTSEFRSKKPTLADPIAGQQALPIPNGPIIARLVDFLAPIIPANALPIELTEQDGGRGAVARYRMPDGGILMITVQASTYPGIHPAYRNLPPTPNGTGSVMSVSPPGAEPLQGSGGWAEIKVIRPTGTLLGFNIYSPPHMDPWLTRDQAVALILRLDTPKIETVVGLHSGPSG